MQARWLPYTAGALCAAAAVLLAFRASAFAQQPAEETRQQAVRAFVFPGAKELIEALEQAESPADLAPFSQAASRIVPTEFLLRGTLSEGSMRLSVHVVAVNSSERPMLCPLGLRSARLVKVVNASAQTQLGWSEEEGHRLWLPPRGRFEADYEFLLPALLLGDGGAILLDLPGAPLTAIELDLPANVRSLHTAPSTVIEVERQAEGGRTHARVLAGTIRELMVRWSDQELAVARSPVRLVFSDTRIVPDLSGVTCICEFRLRASEPVGDWELSLPAGAQLLNVEQLGEVRFDRLLVTRGGQSLLRLVAAKGPAATAHLRITLRYPYAADKTVQVAGPQVKAAVQHAGVVRLQLTPEADVVPIHTEGLLAVDGAQYGENADEEGLTLVWTITGQPFRVLLQQRTGPRQLTGEINTLIALAEGEAHVAFEARLEADRPLHEAVMLLPPGGYDVELQSDEQILPNPPMDGTNAGADRLRVKFARPTTRARLALKYRVRFAPSAATEEPIVVPLPKLLGVKPRLAHLFVGARDLSVWLDEASQDATGATEAALGATEAARLAGLQELLNQTVRLVRAYEVGVALPSVLKLRRARPSIPYYAEAQVRIEVNHELAAVQQTLSVTPPRLLNAGVTVRLPGSLVGQVVWPQGWEARQTDDTEFRLSPVGGRPATGTLPLTWQVAIDPTAESFTIPLVNYGDFNVAWTRIQVASPPDLRVEVQGWAAPEPTARESGTSGVWVSAGLPDAVTCQLRRVPVVSPPACVVRATQISIRFSRGRLAWDCRWLLANLRGTSLKIDLPSNAKLLQARLDATDLTRNARLTEDGVVELPLGTVPPATGHELRLLVEQPWNGERRLWGRLRFDAPTIRGATRGGDVLWILFPPPDQELLLLPATATYADLQLSHILAELGLKARDPVAEWRERWEAATSGPSPERPSILENAILFHGPSASWTLAISFVRLPFLEALIWILGLSSAWLVLISGRTIRSFVLWSVACLLLAAFAWDAVTTAWLGYRGLPGLIGGIVLGMAHRIARRALRRSEFVHAPPDTVTRVRSPEREPVTIEPT